MAVTAWPLLSLYLNSMTNQNKINMTGSQGELEEKKQANWLKRGKRRMAKKKWFAL